MTIDLTYTGLQLLKWGISLGVTGFALGWCAHSLWDWLMFPSGAPGKDRG